MFKINDLVKVHYGRNKGQYGKIKSINYINQTASIDFFGKIYGMNGDGPYPDIYTVKFEFLTLK